MLALRSDMPVYLACGITDLRKSIEGLAAIVQEGFHLDPFAPALFVFCNRHHNKLKILHWETNGFCGGKAHLVRFADDFLVCFEQPQDAQRFAAQLPMRMHQFGLELAPEKTRRLPFGHRAWIATEARHEPRVTFDFLGMTHFGARTRQGRWQLQRRPTKKSRQKFLQKVKQTLKARWHDGILVHQRYLNAALRGFYQYFGYPGCLPGLNTLRQQVLYAWYQVLRRRSQRSPQGWAWYVAQGWFMAPVPKLRPRDTVAR